MTTATLKKELHEYIDTMPEHSLYALKPLMSVLAKPLYTVETDLSKEEIGMIDEGMAEYRANPSSFIPLENLL
jgi:hypothetical protein